MYQTTMYNLKRETRKKDEFKSIRRDELSLFPLFSFAATAIRLANDGVVLFVEFAVETTVFCFKCVFNALSKRMRF